VDAHTVAHESLEWLRMQPAWVSLGTIGAFAGLEYVVPPVPGDTVAIAGGVLVARDILPASLVLLVVTVGSVVGALAAWGIGRLAATHAGVRRVLFRFVDESAFDAAAVKYRRWGRWLIVANRFFPGVRASFLFAAGLFGIPLRDVALLAGLSALAWNALLIGAGVLLGANIDAVIDLVEKYSAFAWFALILILGFFAFKIIGAVVRKRRRDRARDRARDGGSSS
jgi:membrane protein DedA with SNARE-associated domain